MPTSRIPVWCNVLIVLAFGCLAARADFVDSFADGSQTVTADASNGNVGSYVNGLNTSQVLNGERQLTIQGVMSAGSIVATVDTTGDGTITYASNNPVYTDEWQGRLIITNIPGSRVETVDISSYADQFYTVDVLSANLGQIGAKFDASVSIGSPTGSASQTIAFVSSPTPYSVSVPMSSFSGVDLSKAYNLSLDITGLSSTANFTIDNIRFVPEPSTLSLFGLAIACAGIAGFGRRRRRTR